MKPPRLTFYGDVFKYKSAEHYYNHVKELNDGVILQEMCTQNFEVARILHEKYRVSKVSLATFLVALGSWIFFIYTVFKYQI